MAPAAQSLLQTVALTLPAVALYLTVLTELYQTVDEAKEVHEDEITAQARTVSARMDDTADVHRGFVTYTIAEEGWDFRLAGGSFLALVVAAIVLVPELVVESEWLLWIGVVVTVVGYVGLAAALCSTGYRSVTQLYPP